MAFTNSPLVTQTKLVHGHYNPRNQSIKGITIHHNAGVSTVAQLLNYAYNTTRQMSFNYCINDNDIGMLVEEKNRAWTSSNAANDHRCVTIEVCNSSTGGDWPISDKSMATLIKLCADICKRNGITKLYFDGTTKGTLTRHEMFAATNCPGPYIKNHTDYICSEVNKLIGAEDTPAPKPEADKYTVVVELKGYYTAADAMAGRDARVTVKPGEYYIYNKTSSGAINVTKTKTSPGAWINSTLNKTGGSTPAPAPSTGFAVGDMVKVKSGAKSYTGQSIASFVFNNTYRIDELKGDRAVLDKSGICTAFNTSDLIKQGGSSSTNTPSKPAEPAKPSTPSTGFKVGDMVKVKSGAKSYTGQSIASFVYNNTYRIDELKGDRAVLDEKGICTAFRTSDLTKSGGSSAPAKKSNEAIAKEVIQGKWGNGADRKKRLEAAGYDYSTIQSLVNKMI